MLNVALPTQVEKTPANVDWEITLDCFGGQIIPNVK